MITGGAKGLSDILNRKQQRHRQEFICDMCGLESFVMYMDHEPVFSVVRKITAEHEKHSPECKNPTEKLRALK